MDIIDEANELASLFTANAIKAATQMPLPGSPLYIDGVRCCLDCEDPIPLRRLDTLPYAVRCVECQEREEMERLWTG